MLDDGNGNTILVGSDVEYIQDTAAPLAILFYGDLVDNVGSTLGGILDDLLGIIL